MIVAYLLGHLRESTLHWTARWPKPFNAMTIEECEHVLSTLGKQLHFSASIAKHHGDPTWRSLKELGDRVLANFSEIACDASDQADAVIVEAVELLGRYELDRPRGTWH